MILYNKNSVTSIIKKNCSISIKCLLVNRMRNRSKTTVASTTTVETTYGKVTVFNHEVKSDPDSIKRPLSEAANDTQIQMNSFQKSDNGQKLDDVDEDFFGFEKDVDKRRTIQEIKKQENFIDEQFFGEYSQSDLSNVSLNSNPLQVSTTADSKDLNGIKDFDYIDNQFFHTDSSNSGKTELVDSNVKNISADDIKNEPDLNYIDQLAFQEQAKVPDSYLGSIKQFKAKNKPTKSDISSKGEIPLITSQNLIEGDADKKTQKQKIGSKVSASQDEISEHKKIAEEIPNWDYVTIDEGAKILKSSICYFNEEQGLLALDKPYGLPSVAGPKVNLSVSKLLPALEQMLNVNYRLLMAHRLDKSTSGVMLFATNTNTANQLATMFREKKVIKQYLAVTKFIPELGSGEIDIPLYRREVKNVTKTFLSPDYNENTKILMRSPKHDVDQRKNAITKYRVLDSADKAGLLEVQPLTGFQHQIRAHLSFGLGCPILGDHKYSHNIDNLPQRLPIEMLKNLNIKQSKVRHLPLHLHSYRILLPEFYKATNIFVTAKLPLHFINTLKKLKLKF